MLKKIFLLIALTAQIVRAQTKSKIIVTDLTRIKQISSIKLSPDGQRAVYTVTTTEANPDQKEEYEYRTHLYLTGLDKPNTAKALTRGSESARQPVWSPDGKYLAFARSVKGKSQIFVMPLDGGEAWQLTTDKYGASGPIWSPDGKRIVFGTSIPMADMLTDSLLNPNKGGPVWSLEKPGFADNSFVKEDKKIKANPDGSLAEIRAYLAKDVIDKKAKVINRLNFQGESTTEPDPSFTHLYIIDVREGATAKPLTRGFSSFQASNWLPNGQGLLAVTDRDSLKHPDREQDNAIVYIPADGSGKRTTVLAEAGKSYGSPEISPDGNQLSFSVSPSEGVNFGQIGLATLNGSTVSNPQLVTFDRAAGSLTWATAPSTAKGRKSTTNYAIYFTASSNGGTPLYRLDPTSRQVTQLTDFESGITSFDVSGNQVVFSKTEVKNPSELYRSDATAKVQTQLTNHNDWVAQRQLSFPEKRTYKNSIGQTVDYWIMKPVGDISKKHPLLLNMHGGPTAMWGPGEASMWHEFQYMCAQGYGVVYANPRGSGGYGLAFQRANIKDWGTGPAEDVLAAATDAAKEAWVDTSRQVITGGSYAGYLTAWIVGHDNRFKAAFAQRGVYDLTTFMGEGNAWRLVPNYFAYPWTADAKVLDANSPYTFVQNIKTPLLIKHGENDLRTGIIQSEMLYKSLKVLGRPVEYVRMPGATHELSRTGNVRQRIDRMLRIYEFFERYVGDGAQGLTQK
ncbi:S9 family peptidase [Spirosoma utsteinense]|uniref:Dipeptidyl aminopeptidase/acylaminoacyl peptidase n=1 Tax=Spirosoma utsteinense TaxID=2585773 RepID=A0ABR6W526_9BACT|nr:S9 family peptidase [Spirosoma utsteinense]MBC3784331.1 dipeptidyl aminopeptidase/acylaminoacyl peptidase [Spirosoma utsteinense]MBC3790870.1 dipeptidyl aminopeptidase/acylaminoacyl peptidase [Spirosoma utsteinense]